MAGIQKRWKWIAVLTVVAGLLSWLGWNWWENQRYRHALAEINADIEAGRNGLAVRKLTAILEWSPGSDDAAYLLGTCEKARGRIEAASEAWARVPPGSSFKFAAIQGRIQLQIDRGRLAGAEELIKDMLDDPRLDRMDLPDAFVPAFLAQGRVDEAERLIEARWNRVNERGDGASEQAINLIRTYIELRGKNTSIEATRTLLDDAARLAPDDDRIWLGKANLEIRAGSYDEAARWLDACLRRRPRDHAVWRARLNWALAAGRVADGRSAAKHLSADEFTPPQLARVAARIAALNGNAVAERLALERVIAADPADFISLERLAELTLKDGRPARAAELHRKKKEIEPLLARYQKLYERYQPERDAAEMASLARRLGRQFESRAFLTVAVAVDPQRHDLASELARLDRNSATTHQAGRALIELFDTGVVDPGGR